MIVCLRRGMIHRVTQEEKIAAFKQAELQVNNLFISLSRRGPIHASKGTPGLR